MQDAEGNPEHQLLFLPHHLSLEHLDGCVDELANIEDRLREGQMCSSLDSLQVQLHVRSRLLTFKARNVRHQCQNTCSQQQLEACQLKIKALVQKYRAACLAKLAICGTRDWKRKWRPLADRDMRGLSEMEPQVNDHDEPLSRHQQITEGCRLLSWIWLSADWDEGSEATAVEGMTEGMF